MKKITMISVFIFLTSIFAGLFFSTNLSPANNAYLGGLLIKAVTDSEVGFIEAILSSLATNLLPFFLMLSALLTHRLAPLPMAVLACKSFATGFCSGLIYINASDNAFTISLLKLLPQSLFFVPAFIGLCTYTFYSSIEKGYHGHRSRGPAITASQRNRIVISVIVMIFLGCMIEAAFLQIKV